MEECPAQCTSAMHPAGISKHCQYCFGRNGSGAVACLEQNTIHIVVGKPFQIVQHCVFAVARQCEVYSACSVESGEDNSDREIGNDQHD